MRRFSARQTARAVGVSVTAVLGRIRRGSLAAVLEVDAGGCRRWVIDESEIQRWIAVRVSRGIDARENEEHREHCRIAGCNHPPAYAGRVQGWCNLCRAVAFAGAKTSDEAREIVARAQAERGQLGGLAGGESDASALLREDVVE